MQSDTQDLSFISQTSNKYKLGVFIISIVILMILVGGIIALSTTFNQWLNTAPVISQLKTTLSLEIKSLSPVGLFYTGFAGGLFFFFLPQETLFYLSLIRGNPILFAMLMILSGHLLSQGVNYFVGRGLNKIVIQIVSKKRLYKARRFVNKHGAKGIFLFNFLPLPAPLLSLGLGITKYNIYRLFFYVLLGTALKYAIIAGVFLLLS